MIRGRCLCNEVCFEATQPPKFSCHCHCEWCRRAHGAAFVTWLGLHQESFAFTSGASTVRWYASSEQSERGFCTRCGTTLFFRSKLAPGEIHVALACVDGAEAFPPTAHVFWEARVPWCTLADDLRKLGRDHPGLDKYQVIARTP